LDKAPEAFRIISEVAEDLDVPQHVLRFWESRFAQIKPMKRGGGRRYYRPEDVDLLRGIRHLLYGEGYTIRGVQRILREEGVGFVQRVWQEGAPQLVRGAADAEEEHENSERGGILSRLPGLFRAGAEDADKTFVRREPTLGPQSAVEASEAEPPESEPREAELSSAEPIIPAASSAPPIEVVAGAKVLRMADEHLHQLDAALYQLTECRRRLDEAFDDR
jgi:DNA-binding transcriptional MerR regulator